MKVDHSYSWIKINQLLTGKKKPFNKELENIKRNQTELNNITEILKYTRSSRLDDTEEWIRELEDGIMKITKAEQKKE